MRSIKRHLIDQSLATRRLPTDTNIPECATAATTTAGTVSLWLSWLTRGPRTSIWLLTACEKSVIFLSSSCSSHRSAKISPSDRSSRGFPTGVDGVVAIDAAALLDVVRDANPGCKSANDTGICELNANNGGSSSITGIESLLPLRAPMLLPLPPMLPPLLLLLALVLSDKQTKAHGDASE
jgi:hypothetical protein